MRYESMLEELKLTNVLEQGTEFTETEFGPLPVDWEVVRLGEVCERPQYGYTTSAMKKPSGTKFLRITDIQEGHVNWATVPYCEIDNRKFLKYELQLGDIFFARIGATTGKSYCITECPPSIFASYLIRVRPKPSLIADFLKHFANSQTYWSQINASKGGRLKQGINIPVLIGLSLPLPSLPEQRRIAHVLNTIQRQIADHDILIGTTYNSKRLIIGALNETTILLSKIATIKDGKARPKVKGDIPVVGSGGVYAGTNVALVKHPTIVIGKRGSVGKVWLMEQPCWPSWTTYYLELEQSVNIIFMYNYLLFRQPLSEQSKTVPIIKRETMESFPIALPSVREQQIMACTFIDADNKITQEEQRKLELQELYTFMLNQLITGQLRVKESNLDEI